MSINLSLTKEEAEEQYKANKESIARMKSLASQFNPMACNRLTSINSEIKKKL